jgi:hypothetical protein
MAASKKYIAAQFFFLGFFSLLFAHVVWGQSAAKKPFLNELSITSINDNYAPPFKDRYFSNGFNITFSRAIQGRFLRKKTESGLSEKSIIRFGIAHEIYTPKNITERNPLSYDRPYAGYLFAKFSVDSFWESRNGLRLAFIAGIIGPKAGGGRVQSWWHSLFSLKKPEGWENQISNVPVFNLGLMHQRSWLQFQRFDVISTTGAEVGTGFNNLSAGALVRTGDIKPIDHSAITASMPGGGTASGNQENEWYFFLGAKNSFVLHNTLIEGNLFHPSKSGFTESAEFYLLTLSAGFAHSTSAFTVKATMNRLSPEVVGGDNHTYASLEMAVRF